MKTAFSQKQNTQNHSIKPFYFMMLFIISFVSISPLHIRRRLPYIIEDDRSEGL